MADIFHLFVIALVQGLTEFLPVSSSGHLVLLPALTGWADQGRGIDVAAHIGTLAAVLVWWRADILSMLRGLLSFGRADRDGWQLFWLLVVASLPVILAGFLVSVWAPGFLRLAGTVALANILFALWLWWADSRPEDPAAKSQITGPRLAYGPALLIGLAQILALIPGASRSGVTISMARQLGWPRAMAARFSMLLSVPVIAGAGFLSALDMMKEASPLSLKTALVTAGLSFVFALLAIRWMMGWLERADFRIFVWYRLALGGLLLAGLGFGWL